MCLRARPPENVKLGSKFYVMVLRHATTTKKCTKKGVKHAQSCYFANCSLAVLVAVAVAVIVA